MNNLPKSEEALVPVNQPINFPTFYTIPETHSVRRRTRAANFPDYHYQPQPVTRNRCTEVPTSPLRRLHQKLLKFRAEAWAKLKELGRNTVRWIAWRVILPLSIASACWIPYVSPAELPY